MNIQKSSFLLLLILCVFPVRGHAEFLYGQVVEVNRDAQEFVLVTLLPDKNETDLSGNTARIRVKAMGEMLPQAEDGDSLLPGCVQVGKRVRVWGESPASGSTFLATDVRGCGGMGCSDPTGVRSRLQKDKKRKYWNKGTDSGVAPSTAWEEVDSSDVDGGGRTGRGSGRGNGGGGSGNGGGGGGGRGR